jgi:hypothetical protein
VDFTHHQNYIHQNPVERRMVAHPSAYRYCSAFPGFRLDSWPPAAKAEISKADQTGTSKTRALPNSRARPDLRAS